MTRIPFYKMSGSGNDFIIIDDREAIAPPEDRPAWVARVCRRRLSVGADGLILLQSSAKADFKWDFYNADGSAAEMCGNGARCAARFAWLTGMTGHEMRFETAAGIITAHVQGDQVKLKMTEPSGLVLDENLELSSETLHFSRVNTGVPHLVVETSALEDVDVIGQGRALRYHPRFAPTGTNVNFVAPLSGSLYAIRTYERGVEDETLACGTGNVAAALILAARYGLKSPVRLQTRSGSVLTVHYQRSDAGFHDVYLEGDARVVYAGEMWAEAWA